ncbi:MAG: MFS transporter [Oscillospiraceae bacterium]|nr:MFS transporter [Oscillospiraceae bacterium]
MNGSKKITQRAVLTTIGAFLITTGAASPIVLSVFFPAVAGEMNFSQSAISLHVSIFTILGLITQPIGGRLFDKFRNRIKLLAVLGTVIALISFFLFSRCTRIYHFYLVSAFMSLTLPVVSSLLGVYIVTAWFDKKRSFAISFVMIGSSAGTVIYANIARYFIDNYDWRAGYISVGISLAIIMVIGIFLLSPPPDLLGLKPYGSGQLEDAPAKELSGISYKDALRTKAFWLCAIGTLFGMIYVVGISQALTPLLQSDYQLTAAKSTAILSVYSITIAVVKPLIGLIIEKLGTRKAILFTGILLTISLAVISVSKNVPLAIAFIVCLGCSNMLCTVILSTYVADTFGRKDYGSIMGSINIASMLGTSLAPLASGYIYDICGSYRPTFLLFTALSILAMNMYLLAGGKAKARKKAAGCQI